MILLRILSFFLAIGVAISSQDATAAPGDLDLTFGTGGSVVTPLSVAVFGQSVVTLQPDGKILVASDSETSNADTAVARYDTSGALDPTWGTGGISIIATSGFSEVPVAIAVQDDGKVLVAAASIVNIRVARLDSSGSLDGTWGTGGIASTNLTGGGLERHGDLVLLPDGRSLVGGAFLGDLALTRLETDGSIDLTFGGNGSVVTDVGATATLAALAVRPDGSIVSVGSADGEIVITQHFGTGVPDPSWGVNGLVVTSAGTSADDIARDVLVEPDGKVAVLGQDGDTGSLDETFWIVARYETDGTLDATWGTGGVTTTSVPGPPASSNARALVRQNDGKFLAVGESLPDPVMNPNVDVASVRYESDGDLDTTWGGTGVVLDDFGSIVEIGTDAILQSDGKLIAVGSHGSTASQLVARYEVGPYCGDGILQGGESCDDGNGLDGDCCSSTCSFETFGATCVDDGDACTSDTCDGAGTCVHTPLSEGATCEDGNPCTTGETCMAGVCEGGTPSGVGCVNPFVCYKSKPTKGFPKFGGASAVSLSDDLESGSFDIKNQFELCVPAAVNNVGVLDPGIRQVAYKLRPASGQPKHVKQTGIVVQDHFGIRSYDTKKAELLLAPANLSLVSPPSAPGIGDADYFKCYKVKLTKGQPQFPRSRATATDEFEDRFYDVFSPRRLCYPADKDGQGITDPTNVITCYRLRRATLQPNHEKIVGLIHTADGLVDSRLDSVKERDLCMPGVVLP